MVVLKSRKPASVLTENELSKIVFGDTENINITTPSKIQPCQKWQVLRLAKAHRLSIPHANLVCSLSGVGGAA